MSSESDIWQSLVAKLQDGENQEAELRNQWLRKCNYAGATCINGDWVL